MQGGREAYDADDLRREAGDSLMMKIGEAASRLTRADIGSPQGVEWGDAVANRNWLIHQYDQIDRNITWATLTTDLPAWREALSENFDAAEALLDEEAKRSRDE